MTIILHALPGKNQQQEKIHYHKSFFNKNHSPSQVGNSSSSSISLSRLTNKIEQLLNKSLCLQTQNIQKQKVKLSKRMINNNSSCHNWNSST